MYLSKTNLSLLLLCFLLVTTSLKANTKYVDLVHTPSDFNSVENLFLSHKCKFIWLVAYQYDPKTEIFSSVGMIKDQYPKIKGLFGEGNEVCKAKISLNKINEALGSDISANDDSYLLYFDAPFDPVSGQVVAFNKIMKERIQKRRAIVSDFSEANKIVIRTPLTGLKAQKL